MPYVIQRADGAFVAREGSASSYTRDLLKARQWPTRDAAELERCPGNEQVRDVRALLERGR